MEPQQRRSAWNKLVPHRRNTKKSKYTEKKLGRKITDEDLAKLREVAQVTAKLVDAWGPDNVDHATIWLAHGKKMDDIEEFIKKHASDPEKAFKYLNELRKVMHKHIKPKSLVARRQKVESSLLLEIQRELQSLREENEKLRREMEGLRKEISELKMLILKNSRD